MIKSVNVRKFAGYAAFAAIVSRSDFPLFCKHEDIFWAFRGATELVIGCRKATFCCPVEVDTNS